MNFAAPCVFWAALRRRKVVAIGTGLVLFLAVVLLQIGRQDFVTIISAVQQDIRESLGEGNDRGGKAYQHPALPASPSSTPSDMGANAHESANHSYSKSLVVSRTKDAAVKWINEALPYKGHGLRNSTRTVAQEWNVFIYTADDAMAEHSTPANKGHEAMVYLTYIIENYDKLDDITVFVHHHRTSWHDNYFDMNTVEMLARLRLDRVVKNGFLNLRCLWAPGCPSHIHPRVAIHDAECPEMAFFPQAWKELFSEEAPEQLGQPCCGQFAVTSERLRLLPLSRYIAMRDWILTTKLENAISGRIFEYLYHYIWTGESILCPEEHECYCQNYGICFAGKRQYEEFVSRRRELLWFKAEIQEYIDDDSNPFSLSRLLRLIPGRATAVGSEETQEFKGSEGRD